MDYNSFGGMFDDVLGLDADDEPGHNHQQEPDSTSSLSSFQNCFQEVLDFPSGDNLSMEQPRADATAHFQPATSEPLQMGATTNSILFADLMQAKDPGENTIFANPTHEAEVTPTGTIQAPIYLGSFEQNIDILGAWMVSKITSPVPLQELKGFSVDKLKASNQKACQKYRARRNLKRKELEEELQKEIELNRKLRAKVEGREQQVEYLKQLVAEATKTQTQNPKSLNKSQPRHENKSLEACPKDDQ